MKNLSLFLKENANTSGYTITEASKSTTTPTDWEEFLKKISSVGNYSQIADLDIEYFVHFDDYFRTYDDVSDDFADRFPEYVKTRKDKQVIEDIMQFMMEYYIWGKRNYRDDKQEIEEDIKPGINDDPTSWGVEVEDYYYYFEPQKKLPSGLKKYGEVLAKNADCTNY